MRSAHRGFVANVLGNGWTAVMAVIFAPVYIRHLGIEVYGLIGVSMTLQGLFAAFDLGIGRTLTRERVRLQSGRSSAQTIRDLQLTGQLVCFAIAALSGTGVVLAAPWISRHWLRIEALPHADAALALQLAGVTVGLRWLCTVHRSTLHGLSDHTWANAHSALFATLRGAASAGVVIYISASAPAFFLVQLVSSACELASTMLRVYRKLPGAPQRAQASYAKRSYEVVKSVWRFSAGVLAVTVLTVLIAQLDRVMLSRLVPLSQLGCYALAASLSGAVRMLFYPTSQALPRFALFVETGQREALIRAFHQCCQLLAILLIPACVVLCVFGEELLTLWGIHGPIAQEAATVLRWLLIGTGLNGLMSLLYALQLAHDDMRRQIRINAVMLAVYAPLLWIGIRELGAQGAAAAWALENFICVAVGAPILLRVFPRIELWRWARHDVLEPLLVVAVIVWAIRLIVSQFSLAITPLGTLAAVGLAGVCALGGACAATAVGRELFRDAGRGWISPYVER